MRYHNAALTPCFQNSYNDCSSQRAWTVSDTPAGLDGFDSYENSVTHRAFFVAGSAKWCLTAARATRVSFPRSGTVTSSTFAAGSVGGPTAYGSIATASSFA